MTGDEPKMTLGVESHDDALWLVAMWLPDGSRKLARFKSQAAVEEYKRLAHLRDMYMQALGQLGI